MTFVKISEKKVELILGDIEARLRDAWLSLAQEIREKIKIRLILLGLTRQWRSEEYVEAVQNEIKNYSPLLVAWSKMGAVFQTVATDRWRDICVSE